MLALSGVAAVSGLAGCAAFGGDDGDGSNETDDEGNDTNETNDETDETDAGNETDEGNVTDGDNATDEDNESDAGEGNESDAEDGYSLSVTVETGDGDPIEGATVWLEGDQLATGDAPEEASDAGNETSANETGNETGANETGNETGANETNASNETSSGNGTNANETGNGTDTSSEYENETGGNGTVEFTGLADGEYTVLASAEGYAESEETVEIDGGNTETTITLEEGGSDLAVETEYNSREEYAQPGDSFDDFEDLSSWSITEGNAEEDTDISFTGSQSVRLYTEEEGANMVIERDLESDNPDLTDLDFSMAVRTPTPENIAVELRFVDVYGSSRIYQLPSIAYRGGDAGWFRTAPGVFEEDEYPPEMDFLDRLEVRIHHTGEGAEVWVDDIRTHQKPDSGYVVLGWDDGLRTFYEEASPLHDEYGVNAVQSVVRQWIIGGREDVMTRGELLERQEAGDQIVGHGTHARFAEMEPDQLRDSVETDKQFKVNSGFEGANFLTFPHNSFNSTVLDIVSDYYYAGGYNQAGNVNLTAVYGFDPLVLPRTIGHDLELCQDCVDTAAQYNQCTVLNFHDFGLDNTIDRDEYDQLLEYIDGTDNVEVITLDELWEMRTENQ
ncbi:polysaccharide deacetylase family protein [Saliphagus sp. LR7]|uniref:polysaccharide deacetylase family protein n=1 Tax=Saliphagus sp. LR7 TaxID=2282654 RepID=UPI001E489D4B|nr:polysaccharide deacetylase family protein [Saliphagus sp. LR7]